MACLGPQASGMGLPYLCPLPGPSHLLVSSHMDKPLKNSTSVFSALQFTRRLHGLLGQCQEAGVTLETEGSSELTGPRSHSS